MKLSEAIRLGTTLHRQGVDWGSCTLGRALVACGAARVEPFCLDPSQHVLFVHSGRSGGCEIRQRFHLATKEVPLNGGPITMDLCTIIQQMNGFAEVKCPSETIARYVEELEMEEGEIGPMLPIYDQEPAHAPVTA